MHSIQIKGLGFFTDLYAASSTLFSIPFSTISNILLAFLQLLSTELTFSLNYPQELPDLFLSGNS